MCACHKALCQPSLTSHISIRHVWNEIVVTLVAFNHCTLMKQTVVSQSSLAGSLQVLSAPRQLSQCTVLLRGRWLWWEVSPCVNGLTSVYSSAPPMVNTPISPAIAALHLNWAHVHFTRQIWLCVLIIELPPSHYVLFFFCFVILTYWEIYFFFPLEALLIFISCLSAQHFFLILLILFCTKWK